MTRIFAEQTVSISELRKNPAKYFTSEPVAILSNNKPAGYLLSAELFEKLLAGQVDSHRFRPSKARLLEIVAAGERIITDSSAQDLDDFVEHTSQK